MYAIRSYYDLGNAIGAGISYLSLHSGLLTGAVIGASIMFLVVLGLHWGLVPISYNFV